MPVRDRLQDVFRKVLKLPDLVIEDQTSAADIEAWDSMNHVMLILEVEKTFKVKFRNAEIAKLKCVGDLVALIERHLGK